MKTIIYQGSNPWKYYLNNIITGENQKVTEETFFDIIGYDRNLIPMKYDKENINKQNFYWEETIIGYRERK